MPQTRRTAKVADLAAVAFHVPARRHAVLKIATLDIHAAVSVRILDETQPAVGAALQHHVVRQRAGAPRPSDAAGGRRIAFSLARSAPRDSGRQLGPSHSACSGSGWNSRKTPSAPAATAASGQHRHALAPAAGRGAVRQRVRARQLDGVGGVDGHRGAQAPASRGCRACRRRGCCSRRRTPRSQRIVRSSSIALLDLVEDVAAVERRQELALSSRAARPPCRLRGAGAGDHEIGLAAEEGGNLQHVGHRSHRSAWSIS